MGYEKGQSPEPFPDMISIALSQSVDLANIKGSLRVSDHFLLDRSGYIEIDSVTFGVGKKIARQLKNAEGGVLFICTAGPGIGEKSKELMSAGDLMEGYILDVIGSLTVDAAIDKIQSSLEDEFLKEGKKIAMTHVFASSIRTMAVLASVIFSPLLWPFHSSLNWKTVSSFISCNVTA